LQSCHQFGSAGAAVKNDFLHGPGGQWVKFGFAQTAACLGVLKDLNLKEPFDFVLLGK
jgi:hypothetical protein|tara:strand:+ start:164 stop:337 length:174 start_codon:yes stop_codon:yes gene_type:complete